jgi:hypothetical protein
LQLLKTGQHLKFDFSEYAPACMVIDTCTGNEAFLRPEQYLNPKFQLINWIVVRLNGRGSSLWADKLEDLSLLYATDQYSCQWSPREWLDWIVHSLSLWPRDKQNLELYDYWLMKLRGSDLDVPFMDDAAGLRAFDFFGDWETRHGKDLLAGSTDVDSEVVVQNSFTEDESVYEQNQILWSEFVMSVAHLAASEQTSQIALEHSVECNAIY